jgi:hypothetical protein
MSHLLAALLALGATLPLGACSDETEPVRVHRASTDRVYGYDRDGVLVEATYVDGGANQGYWELLLPGGGSVAIWDSVYISPSQGSYSFEKRVDGVRPGDDVEIYPFGFDGDPEGCRCQQADDPELDLDRVDAFISIRHGEKSTSTRYSAAPVPSTDVRWYLTCETLGYAELRERLGVVKCGSPRRI